IVFLFLSCNSSLKPISNCISFSSLQQLVAERDDIVAKILLVTSNTFVLVFFVIAVFYLKCWAFEVVPFLQKKYKVFSKQVSSPRIFRWLLATNNELVDINELFDPPQDSEVEEHLLQFLREFLVVLVMEEEGNLLQMLIDVLMVLISKEEETSVILVVVLE
ncbi:hypothetical protein AABB24_003996, partial [Solanum stoloniferum]